MSVPAQWLLSLDFGASLVPAASRPRGHTVMDHATLASSYPGGQPGPGTPGPPPPSSQPPPSWGSAPGGPPPPWNSPPPAPPGPPPPPNRTPLILAAVAVVVVIIGIAVVLLVSGGDDDSGIADRPDTTSERRSTTTDEPATTDEPTTTEEPTTTTDEPTTAATLVVPPPPTPAPATTPPPTPAPTEPPTTPPPPPAGPTVEQLAASVPSLNDFPVPGEWVPVPDVPEIPVCEGFTGDNFPDSDMESRQVFSNTRTLQSAAGLLQSYGSEEAARNAFLAWTSLFNCPNAFSPEIHPLDLGAPICTDQIYYYADFFDNDGDFYLRSSIAGQRCGKNVGIWYYDETTDIDVTLSTAHAETFFKTNIYRLAALPS